MTKPRRNTKVAGRVFSWVFLVGWCALVGYRTWEAWNEASAQNPGLGVWTFVRTGLSDQLPQLAAGLFAVLALMAIIYGVPGLDRTARRPDEPITPRLVLHRYPVHLGVCVAMLVLIVWGLFTHPGLATVGVVGALVAFVSLARRLGLEPENDPTAPHNRGKV